MTPDDHRPAASAGTADGDADATPSPDGAPTTAPGVEPPPVIDRRQLVWRFIARAPSLPGAGARVGEATAAVEPWPHQILAYGADPLVERRVVVVVDLQPTEPLLDLSCSPGRRDTGALEGQQDRQAPTEEMVPAGSVDRADDRHVRVALASPDRPARVCRRRVARLH